MKTRAIAAALGLSCLAAAAPLSAIFSQCGGMDWTGSTACVAGAVCAQITEEFSQCIPASITTVTVTATADEDAVPTALDKQDREPAPLRGSRIRTGGYFLQNEDGVAILGPASSAGYFTFGSTNGGTIALHKDSDENSRSDATPLYLRINPNDPYGALIFDADEPPHNWSIQGGYIVPTAPTGARFIVCSKDKALKTWRVYVQVEGKDMVPPGVVKCAITSLSL
ncbi:uncharacterized protein BXZ73DRAFT_103594 [Epithele typhae]|uniref:uncharacterized protein n=1 Tax=Epithele typhae TaxID=378194 RepID=UPI00200793CD|nr:uncharacterized protein BXZ73DRAFT_103594 [Epithele typhae]KAH9924306.1 hypothetical protein BXZ73DRAFT_103594 [Epithele typhae]